MMRTVRIAKTHVGKVRVVPLHGYRTLCGEPLGPVETIEAVRAAGNVVDEWAPGEAPERPLDPETGCQWCIESLADARMWSPES